MCGIVGIAGKMTIKHNTMFRDLLILDQIRGKDSTGIMAVDMQGRPYIYKCLGGPLEMKQLENYDKTFDPKKHSFASVKRILLGHNRHATIGDIDLDSAHPFDEGSVIGVHNGTLVDWADLEDYKTLLVDSQAIYRTIDKRGLKETWGAFSGAAALAWYDKGDDTLNFIRNSERPLYFCYSAANDCLFWASEKWMITITADKNNVSLAKESYKGKDGKDVSYIKSPVMFAEHTHYKFKITNSKVELVGKEVLDGNKPSKRGEWEEWDYYRCYGAYDRAGFQHKGNYTGPKSQTTEKQEGKKEEKKIAAPGQNVYKITGDFPDFFRARLVHDENVILHIVKAGLGGPRVKALTEGFRKSGGLFVSLTKAPDVIEGKSGSGYGRHYEIYPGFVKIEKDFNQLEYFKNLGFKKDNVVDLKPKVVGRKNNLEYTSANKILMTRQDWEDRYSTCTCMWCGGGLSPDQHDEILFVSNGSDKDYLCQYCTSSADLGQALSMVSMLYREGVMNNKDVDIVKASMEGQLNAG